MREYLGSKKNKKDNGSTWWFVANARYSNLKTNVVHSLDKTNVYVNINHQYGNMEVVLQDLPDGGTCFDVIPTSFGKWSYDNGVLKIKGKDLKGDKGDYVVVIL